MTSTPRLLQPTSLFNQRLRRLLRHPAASRITTAVHLHVIRKDPQSREVVLQKDVDRYELQICAQQWLVVTGVRPGNKQSVPPEDKCVVLADVVRRLYGTASPRESNVTQG